MTTAVAPRTLRRFIVHANGDMFGPSGKRLQAFPVKGYLRVTRYTDNVYVAEPVHRLVCEAFHGPAPKGKPFAAHINGDHMDNRAVNLRWASGHENEADKKLHGTALLGERHHSAKLTENDIRAIRASSESSTTLGPKFGVSPANIRAIRARKNWKHVA